MTTTERLANIANVANKRDENIKNEEQRKRERIAILIQQIETKAKQVFPDIFKIAETLVSNGYYIGDKTRWDESPTFCTDGISHGMGFYLASRNPFLSAKGSMPVAFGCQGGGWNGTDFKISKEGKVISYDYNHCWCKKRMESFCYDLDKFCERFYAWVDNMK